MTRSALAVTAAVILAVSGVSAAQTARTGHFGPPVYLALGDSVAAGAGAEPYLTGYPEQLGGLLEHGYNPWANGASPHVSVNFDVVNVAVGGATTATVIATQLPDAVRLIRERRRDWNPFNNVEVVTVTIGGNDIFNPVVAACVTTADPARCQPTVNTALTAVQAGLVEILQQLARATDRRTEVLITTYYNPIGACFLSELNPAAAAIADVVLEGGALPGLLDVDHGLNDLIRDAAASGRVQVAETYGALTAGQYVGGRDCLHPNLAGHTAIAGRAYETLAR